MTKRCKNKMTGRDILTKGNYFTSYFFYYNAYTLCKKKLVNIQENIKFFCKKIKNEENLTYN